MACLRRTALASLCSSRAWRCYPPFTHAGKIGDRIFCRRPANHNTPSRRVLGGWAWLTSIMLTVIGRPSNNVGLQFGEMSATLFSVADKCCPQFYDVGGKYLRLLSANVNSRLCGDYSCDSTTVVVLHWRLLQQQLMDSFVRSLFT